MENEYNNEDPKGYHLKFIKEVKRITKEIVYSSGLKKFKLLALLDTNLIKKYTRKWQDVIVYAKDLTDEEKIYIKNKIDENKYFNCICGHIIEKLSFWEYENIIYLIGCDCVRKHPYFDKFMTEKLKQLEDESNDKKKELRKKEEKHKKLLKNMYDDLERNLFYFVENEKNKKEQLLRDSKKELNKPYNLYLTFKCQMDYWFAKLEKDKERWFNYSKNKIENETYNNNKFLDICLTKKNKKVSIRELIKDGSVKWYFINHPFFTKNEDNKQKLKNILQKKK